MAAALVAANTNAGKHSRRGLKRTPSLQHSGFRSFQHEIEIASTEEKHVRADNLAGFRKAHEDGARMTATLQKKIVAEKVTWQERFVCLTDGTSATPTKHAICPTQCASPTECSSQLRSFSCVFAMH